MTFEKNLEESSKDQGVVVHAEGIISEKALAWDMGC
jgi:hypothetical protein